MMQTLGMILRDGTTVRLPYLTTREGYVQRIRLVNRGPETKYTFSVSDNAMVTEGMDEGMLKPGRTTMRVDELVTVTETSTTSGTLIIEAQPGMIDVATTLNTADGSTDTVIH